MKKVLICLSIFVFGVLSKSCSTGLTNNKDSITNDTQIGDSIVEDIDNLIYPNADTLLLWENGELLCTNKSNRDYKLLLQHYCFQEILTASDVEKIYPTSVEEMSWFYSQLMSNDSIIHQKMCRMDTLMTLYADRDSLSCLTRFLNMYFIMDPRVINRDWIGDWNLNRVMYSIIPDNKQSFKSYYDTLDSKYEWLTKEWIYAYQHF